MERVLDRAANFASRYEKLLGALGFAWLMFTGAVYARFINLPDIPYLTDRNAWMISGPWNMLWWGYLQPAIHKRKAAIAHEQESTAGD